MSLTNAIKNLWKLAVTTKASSDTQDMPIHQIQYYGKLSDAVAWYAYGFHANPGKNTLGLLVSIGGNPENKAILPGSPKDRLGSKLPTPLEEGEVLFYNPLTQSYIHILKDGSLDISSQKDVNVTTVANVNIVSAVNVNITSTVKTTILASAIELGAVVTSLCNEAFLAFFNAHTHSGGGSGPPSSSAVIGTHTTIKTKAE